jgi:hypothetical protein
LIQGRLVNGSVGRVIGFSTAVEALKQHLEIAKVEGAPELYADPSKKDQLWPLVKFTNGALLLVVPQEFTINNADGGVEARRDQVCPAECTHWAIDRAGPQVPLILAWALSVHKSQGQTIERVRVDLRRTFEKGQGAVRRLNPRVPR